MPERIELAPRKKKREGKKHRKIGRKHRNGRPFGMRGGCGCVTCRARVKEMC